MLEAKEIQMIQAYFLVPFNRLCVGRDASARKELLGHSSEEPDSDEAITTSSKHITLLELGGGPRLAGTAGKGGGGYSATGRRIDCQRGGRRAQDLSVRTARKDQGLDRSGEFISSTKRLARRLAVWQARRRHRGRWRVARWDCSW